MYIPSSPSEPVNQLIFLHIRSHRLTLHACHAHLPRRTKRHTVIYAIQKNLPILSTQHMYQML